MGFNTKKAKTSNIELPEADFHEAIIIGLVDFGEVTTEWDGNKKTQDKIAIMYYLETERTEGEGRFLLTTSYNFSFNEKSTLYKHLTGAFGTDVLNVEDLTEILGEKVRVLVDHVEKKDGTGTYAKIDSLRPTKGADVTVDGFELPTWIKEANEKGEVEAIEIYEP